MLNQMNRTKDLKLLQTCNIHDKRIERYLDQNFQ